jgi:hypothetical protein
MIDDHVMLDWDLGNDMLQVEHKLCNPQTVIWIMEHRGSHSTGGSTNNK